MAAKQPVLEQPLEIRDDFRDVLPPHTNEQRNELEAMIVADGRVRDAILFWVDGGRKWIVDGMTRYSIATKHNVPFHTLELKFDNDQEAMAFIRRNQCGRRNLTPDKERYLIGQVMRHIAADTSAEEIAEQHGVSRATLFRDKKYAEQLDRLEVPVRDAILNGVVKASGKEIDSLAKLDAEDQKQLVVDVRAGNAQSPKEALIACGSMTKPPKKKKQPKPEPEGDEEVETAEGEATADEQSESSTETATTDEASTESSEPTEPQCPKGDAHVWVSDGEGGTYCEKCYEPQPGTERDWETLAKLHRESKRQIDAIHREFKQRANEPRGQYVRHQVGRLLKHLSDAAALIRQHEPVGEKNGELVTRIQQESKGGSNVR